MITIFSIPKPFEGHIGIIQRNAIQSWIRVHPTCEVILCGDDAGTAETAWEFNVIHIPDIVRNEYGTPLLSSAFDKVRETAKHNLLCYVNSDIIMLSDFIKAVRRISFKKFMMLGQRWNIDLIQQLDFECADWETRLRRYVDDVGILHPPIGSDYFVFPRGGDIGKLPPFAVGRPRWDNWFIYHARKLRFRVVDVTKVVKVIHQNHDYRHVPNRSGNKYHGPEGDKNFELTGGLKVMFHIGDATHFMTPKLILPAIGYNHLSSRWKRLPILVPRTKLIVWFLNKFILDVLRPILHKLRRTHGIKKSVS